MTPANKEIGWRVVKNTVVDRMKNNSLVHKLTPLRKLQRRTRKLNNFIKNVSRLKNYNEYVKMKTAIIRNFTDDSETDDCDNLSDDDYKAVYKCNASLKSYTKRMSTLNIYLSDVENIALDEAVMPIKEIKPNVEPPRSINVGMQRVIKSKSRVRHSVEKDNEATSRASINPAKQIKSDYSLELPSVSPILKNDFEAPSYEVFNINKNEEQYLPTLTSSAENELQYFQMSRSPKDKDDLNFQEANTMEEKSDFKLSLSEIEEEDITYQEKIDQTEQEQSCLQSITNTIKKKDSNLESTISTMLGEEYNCILSTSKTTESQPNEHLTSQMQKKELSSSSLKSTASITVKNDQCNSNHKSIQSQGLKNAKKNLTLLLDNCNTIHNYESPLNKRNQVPDSNENHPKDSGIDDNSEEVSSEDGKSVAKILEARTIDINEDEHILLNNHKDSKDNDTKETSSETLGNDMIEAFSIPVKKDSIEKDSILCKVNPITNNYSKPAKITDLQKQHDEKPKVTNTEIVRKRFKIISTSTPILHTKKNCIDETLNISEIYKYRSTTLSNKKPLNVRKKSRQKKIDNLNENDIGNEQLKNPQNEEPEIVKLPSDDEAIKIPEVENYLDDDMSLLSKRRLKQRKRLNLIVDSDFDDDDHTLIDQFNNSNVNQLENGKTDEREIINFSKKNDISVELEDYSDNRKSLSIKKQSKNRKKLKKKKNRDLNKVEHNNINRNQLENPEIFEPEIVKLPSDDEVIKIPEVKENSDDDMSLLSKRRLQKRKRLNLIVDSDFDDDDHTLIDQSNNSNKNHLKRGKTHKPEIVKLPSDDEVIKIPEVEESSDDDMSLLSKRRLQQRKRLNLIVDSDFDDDDHTLIDQSNNSNKNHLKRGKTHKPEIVKLPSDDEVIKIPEVEESSDDDMSLLSKRRLQQRKRLNLIVDSDFDDDDHTLIDQFNNSNVNQLENGKTDEPEIINSSPTKKRSKRRKKLSKKNNSDSSNFSKKPFKDLEIPDREIIKPSSSVEINDIITVDENGDDIMSTLSKRRLWQRKRLNLIVDSDSDLSEDDASNTRIQYENYENSLKATDISSDIESTRRSTISTELNGTLDKNTIKGPKKKERKLSRTKNEAVSKRTHQSFPIKLFPRKSPRNLQEFVEEEALIEDTTIPSFTLNDICEDEDVFILDISEPVLQNKLQGRKFLLTDKKLKLDKKKYKVTYKNLDIVSCVLSTGNSDKPYRTVNVKPSARIVAQRRIRKNP